MTVEPYINRRWAMIHALTDPLCRVCHRPCTWPRNGQHPAEALCFRHRPEARDFLAVLGRRLVELQDHFLNPGGTPVPGQSVIDNWKDRTNACNLECEKSLIELSPLLEQLQASYRQHHEGIKEILEMKFWAGKAYNYSHCAFILVLSDDLAVVFDPTGLQFGPDWPLLSTLRDYRQRRVGSYNRALELGKLGRNKEWVEGGCEGEYLAGRFAQR
ncbi:hypothetical protein NX059_010628 [Plenodomus lindquistii]|nr:hypothetical protein NX059_010628 [Plenodomus lindquistii]